MPQAYAFAGTTMTVLVSGSETGGAFTVLHVIKPSGSSTPPHSHDRELELSYVLAGTLSAETEGEVVLRSPGEVLVLPPGRPHRLFNQSGGTVREFLLCAPAVFDSFVAAAGRPVEPYADPRPMTGEDRQRLVETAPAFGVRLLRSAEPEADARSLAERPTSGPVPGTGVEVLARLGEGDGDLVLLRNTIEADRTISLHSHPDPECLFVIEGSLEVHRDGDDWYRLGPNEALHVEPGRSHAIRNVSHQPVRLLTVSTVHMLRFLAEIRATERDSELEPLPRQGYRSTSLTGNTPVIPPLGCSSVPPSTIALNPSLPGSACPLCCERIA